MNASGQTTVDEFPIKRRVRLVPGSVEMPLGPGRRRGGKTHTGASQDSLELFGELRVAIEQHIMQRRTQETLENNPGRNFAVLNAARRRSS